jgi:hypothetical protein
MYTVYGTQDVALFPMTGWQRTERRGYRDPVDSHLEQRPVCRTLELTLLSI